MAFFNIIITFVNQEDRTTQGNPATRYDFVELEQVPFEKPGEAGFQNWYRENVGDSANATWEAMNTAYALYRTYDCSKGYFEVEIKAHKSRSDLQYKMRASRGEFIPAWPVATTEQKKQSISITSAYNHVFAGENVTSVSCAEWEGDVLDDLGNLILPKPEISVSRVNPSDEYDNRTRLVFSRKCSGVLRIVKDIEYDLWTLRIVPRTLYDGAGTTSGQGVVDTTYGNQDVYSVEGVNVPEITGVDGENCSGYYESGDLEGAYASSVVATWNGGFDDLEITIQEDDLNSNCDPSSLGSSTVVGDDGEEDEDTNCYDLYVVRDKCTNEIVSEELRPVPCAEEG